MTETVFQRHFSREDENNVRRDGASDIVINAKSSSHSRPQDQSQRKSQLAAGSRCEASEDNLTKDKESEMAKRLELLERRFLEPPNHIARNSCESGGSHHSFSFDQTVRGNAAFGTSPTPGSRSRSRESGSNTPSTRNGKTKSMRARASAPSPSTQILENVADQHIKKVSRALSEAPALATHSHLDPPSRPQDTSSSLHHAHSSSTPCNPIFSPASASASIGSNNRSHSMSSNQTLITAHVTKRVGHAHGNSIPATEVIVAESPPITSTNYDRNDRDRVHAHSNKPGTFARHGATPRVARTILDVKTGGDVQSPAATTITPTISRGGNKRKSSVPTRLIEKKRQRNLRFHDRDQSKIENTIAEDISPKELVHTSTNSCTDTDIKPSTSMPITPIVSSLPTNNTPMENHVPGSMTGPNTAGNQKTSANMLITRFFSSNMNSKKKATGDLSIPSKLSYPDSKQSIGHNINSSGRVVADAQISGSETYPRIDHYLQEITILKSTISSLTESLNEKSAQLKAVSNNQTIIHSQLKKALQDRDNEIKSLKEESAAKNTKMRSILEKIIRKESARDSADLRQKLAFDAGRLGKWVYNWTGMRRETVWEDGTAIAACHRKRNELKLKRDILEKRLKEGSKNLGNFDAMEREEFQLSIRVHLDELERAEKELEKEENDLYAEKNAHKLALKQVTNEDYSKFKSVMLNDRYILTSQLGKGGFSEVWRAFDMDEIREVAIKIHQLDTRWTEAKIENYTKHVAREYEIHRGVRHPRIVSLYDVLEIDENSFATVLECCDGTDLDTLLKERKRLPEYHARAILLQILSGMKYLSTPSKSDKRQGIIHYDLKPGNILFDEFGDAKITDFGLSKIMDSPDPSDSMELTSQGAGTYWYLPPECFVTTESVRITNKVDVWSIGVIFYQMLYGKRPFGDGQSQEGVLANNVMLNARAVSFPESPSVSDEAKTFICQCLAYEQALRPNVAELCQHSYVKGKSL